MINLSLKQLSVMNEADNFLRPFICEVHIGTYQASMMEFFVKVINFFVKRFYHSCMKGP